MTDKSTEGSKAEKVKAQQILTGQEVQFSDPFPDVHVASLPIAGCAWIDTADGVVLIGADPENIEARKLRIELLEVLGKEDSCLMSQNSWVYFIDQDKEFLKSKGIDV